MYAPLRGGGVKHITRPMMNGACLLLVLDSNGLTHLGCPEQKPNLTLTHHLVNFIKMYDFTLVVNTRKGLLCFAEA